MPQPFLRGGVGPKPGQFPDISQQRASQQQLINTVDQRSVVLTAGDEPLCVDLVGPVAGKHWRVQFLNAFGVFAVRNLPANGGAPSAGLFLIPSLGCPVESLSDAQSSVNFESRRGIVIPVAWTSQAFGTKFAYTCQAQITQELIVAPGWTIRFITNLAPGTATPGPGAASTAFLQAWGSIEQDLT